MVPSELLALLGVVALFTVGWALLTPPFQSPDETVHFAYVQSLVERRELPGGDPKASPLSSELLTAAHTSNAFAVIFHPGTQPAAGPAAEREMQRRLAGRRADNGTGISTASGYQPLAYGAMAAGYTVADGTVFDRLFAARLVSASMLLVATIGAWLLAGELFQGRVAQLLCAATTGLWPMASFVSGSVNPDGTVLAQWSIVAWLGVRVLRRGLTPGNAVALGLVTGLSLLTKATSLALLPPVALAGLVGAVVAWRRVGWRAIAYLACLVGPAMLLVGGWVAVTALGERPAYGQTAVGSETFNPREFAVYLWQFYLPALPFMQDKRSIIPVISELPVYNTWLGMFWGVYGWVTVWFPQWVYKLFAAVTVGVVAACGTWLAGRLRRAGRPTRRTVAPAVFLATMALGLVGGVHVTDYRFLVGGNGLFAQGRYLLPLLPLFGLVVAGAAQAAGRRQLLAAGTWLAGLIALQLASMGLVMSHFYA